MPEQDHNDERLAELFDPAKYKGFLQTMSHFHNYSRRNILLIFQQMPHATKLADFDRWKKHYGRKIKYGSKSIKILAPVVQEPIKKLAEKIDPDTGAAVLDENGKRVMEEILVPVPTQFEPKRLLDISQTEGEPLPRLAGDVLAYDSTREVFTDALKSLYPAHVNEDGPHIFFDIFQNVVNDGEFTSGSAAFVVCHRFGIEDADAPQPQEQEIETFATVLENIRSTASRVITAIEDKFTIVCKERGINPLTLPETKIAPLTSSHAETKLEPLPPQRLQPLKIMPDSEICVKDRNHYGYTRPELLPLTRRRAEALFTRDMPIYLLHKDNTESMAFYLSDIQAHDGIFGVPHSQWQNSREYIAYVSGDPYAILEAKFIYDMGDSFAVFQLREENTAELQKTYEQLAERSLGIDKNNYRLVYAAALPHTPSKTPEGIFAWFNAEKPEGYSGRAMTVGDILSVKKSGAIASYYINGSSCRELLDFLGIEQKQPAQIREIVSEKNAAPETPNTVEKTETTSAATNATPNKSAPEPIILPDVEVPQIPKEVEVFPYTAVTAYEYGRLEDYARCIKTSVQCCAFIDEEIQNCKADENDYDLQTPADLLVSKYGHNRAAWVLGVFILQNRSAFSPKCIAWAKKALAPPDPADGAEPEIPNEPPTFALKTNKAIIEPFIKCVQKAFDRKPPFKERMENAKKKSQVQNNSQSKE